MSNITYNELLIKYYSLATQNDISEQTVKLFLNDLCNDLGIDLFIEIDNNVNDRLLELFEDGIYRIFKGVPMDYVLGYTYFMGYKFIVNNDVLIPRCETEELVAEVLQVIDDKFIDYKSINLFDVCTGSGNIAISLKLEEDKLNVYASDISDKAIFVANNNANTLKSNVKFYVGDMLQPLIDTNIKADIVVCNPPYIPKQEILESSVVDYEPNIALFGGDTGLYFYDKLLKDIHKVINDRCFIAFEMGWDQGNNLKNLVKSYLPDSQIIIKKDINNKERMMLIYVNI